MRPKDLYSGGESKVVEEDDDVPQFWGGGLLRPLRYVQHSFVACDMPTLHDKNSSTVRIKVSHGMIWYDMVPVRPDSHCKQCCELSRSILRVTKLICGENRPSIAPRQFPDLF